MGESILLALQVYGLGFVISVAIALMIKGLSHLFDRFSGENQAK